jgi:dihydrolipoamide dehydrogenase
MMKSKDKAVTILTKGVEFLLKKNKVTYLKELEVSNLKMKF